MSCYSLDLRKRVIKYLKKGHSKKKASKVFQITTRTIYNWEKLDKKGELKPKNNLIRKPKKIDKKDLEKYILKHPEKTIQQTADHFNVWYQAIYYHIKKLGFTYKKKNFFTQKGMKKEEKNMLEK